MEERLPLKDVVQTANVVSHPVRLGILKRLLNKPCIVSELVDCLGVDQTQISKHLAVLRKAGIVSCDALGRCRLYSVDQSREVQTLIQTLYVLTETRVHRSDDGSNP